MSSTPQRQDSAPSLGPEELALFRRQQNELMLDRYRRSVPYAAFATATLTAVAYMGPGGHDWAVWMTGLPVAVALLLSGPLSRIRWLAARPHVIVFPIGVFIAYAIGRYAQRTGGFESPAISALILLWLFASIIVPLSPIEMVFAMTGHVVTVAAVVVGLTDHPGSPALFLAVSACGLAFTGAGLTFRDKANMRAFQIQRSLDALNGELERRVDEQVAEIRSRAEHIEMLNAQLQQRVVERSRELAAALAKLARPARLSSPPVGAVLNDRFELVRCIDSGGMGDVFEGRDRLTETRVAVKTIHGRNFSDVSSLQRFLMEARAAAGIHHEGIVRTLDIDVTADGTFFQVMELLDGETLAAWLARTSMRPIGVIARIGKVVAEALAAAHAAGVIHRDVKPANVMLVRAATPEDDGQSKPAGEGGVKLLDFGVSRVFEAELDPTSMRVGRMTLPNAILGTPAYMAPEQARDPASAKAPADIYSLGVVLYEALTDLLPDAPTSGATSGVAAVCDLRPEVPATLSRAVMRCLARDPAARPDGATLAAELAAFGQVATELRSGPRLPDAHASTVEEVGLASTRFPSPR